MNPSGLCKCGCGGVAPVADRNEAKRGYVKGQPLDYVNGHAGQRNFSSAYRFKRNAEREAKVQEALRLYSESELSIYAISVRVRLTEDTIKAAAARAGLSRTLTWASASHADCEKVARWLEDEHDNELEAQRLRSRQSPLITVYELDKKMLRLGIHVEHLPTNVWVHHGAVAA